MDVEKENNKSSLYLEGMLQGDEKILKSIYKEFYRGVEEFVLKNSGSKDDAKDLFQETLKILFLQARDGLTIQKSFSAYLRTIYTRRWYNQINRNKKMIVSSDEDLNWESEENSEEKMIENERKLLFRKHFSMLAESCRKILGLVFEGASLNEVASKLEFSYKYVRKRSSECNKHLLNQIKKDPLFEELS